MRKGLKVVSLFDGISCGQVTLERLGIPVEEYLASEIDKFAIKITQKNYPNTIQLGDVNDISFSEVGGADLLMGGSPCQDLSVAKQNRKGLEGERSGLFFKFVEALETIQPKYFLLENVASMKNEDKETITKILCVEPIMINSALVSAQQRKRLYWTNIPNVTQPENKNIFVCDILEEGFHVIARNYARVIYQSPEQKALCLQARDWKGFGNQVNNGVLVPIKLGHLEGRGCQQSSRVYSIYGKSVCLQAGGGGGGAKTGLYKIDLPDGDYIIRKLTPIECERLQTLPDNYTDGISNTQRYKTIGNGWTVDVIAHILKNMEVVA